MNKRRLIPRWPLLCVPIAWVVMLLLYKASTFPEGFPDEVFQWDMAFFVTFFMGTVLGAILCLFLWISIWVARWATRNDDVNNKAE